MATDEDSSLYKSVALFLRTYWVRIAGISLLLSIPCCWHRRIQAGDLGSHVYNAWLAQLIERGQAPGLYLSRQWNNVLFDAALLRVGNWVGLARAEKIVVFACVLIFFWGVFAFIAAVTRRAPWFLVPCLMMLAYGWTFNVGFFNYYTSLGFGFFALAILWHGRGKELLAACAFAALALLAHPQGFLWLVGCAAYMLLARNTHGWKRNILLGLGTVLLFAIRFFIFHHYEAYSVWEDYGNGIYIGSDQTALYSSSSRILSMAALVFGTLCFAVDAWRRKAARESWTAERLPLELYAVAVLATYILPDSIRLPIYSGWIGAFALRLTTISAAMGLCVLAFIKPRWWHALGFSAIATIFFVLLYRDTGVLDRMEQQTVRLVTTLPYGTRVTATIFAPPDSRLPFIVHIVDRACVGRCFSYGNYEPPSGEFRVRIAGESPLVTNNAEDAQAMEAGEYVVKASDLPMAQIYQCDAGDGSALCLRQLAAGEQNGRIAYGPVKP